MNSTEPLRSEIRAFAQFRRLSPGAGSARPSLYGQLRPRGPACGVRAEPTFSTFHPAETPNRPPSRAKPSKGRDHETTPRTPTPGRGSGQRCGSSAGTACRTRAGSGDPRPRLRPRHMGRRRRNPARILADLAALKKKFARAISATARIWENGAFRYPLRTNTPDYGTFGAEATGATITRRSGRRAAHTAQRAPGACQIACFGGKVRGRRLEPSPPRDTSRLLSQSALGGGESRTSRYGARLMSHPTAPSGRR